MTRLPNLPRLSFDKLLPPVAPDAVRGFKQHFRSHDRQRLTARKASEGERA